LHHDRPVRRSLPLASLTFALAAGAAGCFYSDQINERPSAEIERIGSGVPSRGDELQFRAIMLDPDGDIVDPSWRFEACPEDGPCIALDTGTDPVFAVTVPAMAGGGDPTTRVIITLDVADELGATARLPERLELDVVNNTPTVLLQRRGREIGGSFPPNAPIIVTAVGADPDGDPFTLTWELTPARDSIAADRHFIRLPDPESGGEEYELLPDVPGLWTVHVTIFDGQDEVVRDLPIQIIPDAPPCLGASDPPPVSGSALVLDAPRRLSVLVVDDDLDVWPPASNPYLGVAGFRWFVRGPDSPDLLEVASDVAALELDPAQYDPGDLLEVRVEIDDRVGRTIPCAADATSCSIGQDACTQRQTWMLEVR
jgi:hypothetical protein